MVKTEILNERLKRTYSDKGKQLIKVRTNEIYDIADDLISATYEYAETDKNIEKVEEQE